MPVVPQFSAVPFSRFHGGQQEVQDLIRELRTASDAAELVAAYGVLADVVVLWATREDSRSGRSFEPEHICEGLDPATLKELAAEAHRIDSDWLRARVLHVAWDRRRSCTYEQAEVAVDSYLAHAAAVFDPDDWLETEESIRQAVKLAATLGKGRCFEEVLGRIERDLTNLDAKDKLYLSHRLLGLLLEHGRVSPKWAQWARRCAEAHPSDRHRAVAYFELEALLWAALKDHDEKHAAIQRVALQHEGLAADCRPIERPMHLKTALEVYRSIPGQQASIERLTREIRAASRESTRHYKRIAGPAHDFTEEAEASEDHVRGHSLQQALLRLCLVYPVPTEQTHADRWRQANAGSLFRQFIPTVVTAPDGRQVAPASAPGAGPDATALHGFVAREQDRVAKIRILPAMRVIASEHAPGLADILRLCHASPFVPRDRIDTFARGLLDGLRGDFDTAVYRLVPHTENAIREALEKAGMAVTTVKRDGVERYRTMEALLTGPEAAALFGSARSFDLHVLLGAQAGHNLRNEIAHGLTTDAVRVSYVYAWWSTLCLVVLPLALDGAYALPEDGEVEVAVALQQR